MRKNSFLAGVLSVTMVMGNMVFPTAIITAEEETVTHYGGSVTMDGSSYTPLNYEFTLEELIGDNDVDDIKYIVFEGDTDFNIAFNTIYYAEESGYDDEGTYWRYYSELDSYIVAASVLCWDTDTSNVPCFYFQITNWKADGEDHVYTWEVILKSDADADDITGNIVGRMEQSIYAYIETELNYIGKTTQIVVGLEEDEFSFSSNYNIGDVSYSSSDESILTVTDEGLVTAVGIGSADITVTVSGDDAYASASKIFSFTIDKREQGVEAYLEDKMINAGGATWIRLGYESEDNAEVHFEEYIYNVGDISYTSSDENVATVNSYGLITGVGEGAAEITVTAAGDEGTYPASRALTITVEAAEITDDTSEADETVGGTCGDDLTWVLSEDGVLTISGTGEMYDYSSVYPYTAPWYSNRTSIVSVVVEEGVTGIGNNAFAISYENLTSVDLPDSLTSIGDSAFYWCESLTDINISDNVTDIGDYAFSYCNGLADEDGFVIVKNRLYSYCGEDLVIEIPGETITIGSEAFVNSDITSVTISEGVEEIGGSAFKYDADLENVEISNTVTTIGALAFYGCESLKSVTIPSSVTSIGGSAFGYYLGENGGDKVEGFTIYGYSGTAAEAYAEENGFTFINLDDTSTTDANLGDANLDGDIDYLDAMTVLRYDAELIELDEAQLMAGDVNGDGAVDSLDAILILRYDADLISEF